MQPFYNCGMKRVIVHSDINHAYAQIEEMKNPHLRTIPMAVGGSEEKRHGIILTKNDKAKACGIKTGESLREAKAKCPDLMIVHPHYEDYIYYTEKIKDIYRKYTDQVESFGLDEAWMDLSASQRLFGDGCSLAMKIQDEIYCRYGLNVSMGVSFNKVFAKLGSDLFKHKGFVCITPQNYKEYVWPLPVSDLIMVGRHTDAKLSAMGIYTIEDLAKTPLSVLKKRFGKIGGLLWEYANGLDRSAVSFVDESQPVKSVGNSKTLVHDVISLEQLQSVMEILAHSIAVRLRSINKRGWVVSIWLRDTDLSGVSRQKRMMQPSALSNDILDTAMALAKMLWEPGMQLRSVGLNVSDLHENTGFEQLSLFEDPQKKASQQAWENAIYAVQEKYGFKSCRPASLLLDEELCDFDPLSTLHQIHPVSWLKEAI